MKVDDVMHLVRLHSRASRAASNLRFSNEAKQGHAARETRLLSASHSFPALVALEMSSLNALVVFMPLCTKLRRPAGQYCVKEYLRSPLAIFVLAWITRADGMSTVEPIGNWMTRPRFQRTRWPPFVASKSPKGCARSRDCGDESWLRCRCVYVRRAG